jgi:hypothetical protein
MRIRGVKNYRRGERWSESRIKADLMLVKLQNNMIE